MPSTVQYIKSPDRFYFLETRSFVCMAGYQHHYVGKDRDIQRGYFAGESRSGLLRPVKGRPTLEY